MTSNPPRGRRWGLAAVLTAVVAYTLAYALGVPPRTDAEIRFLLGYAQVGCAPLVYPYMMTPLFGCLAPYGMGMIAAAMSLVTASGSVPLYLLALRGRISPAFALSLALAYVLCLPVWGFAGYNAGREIVFPSLFIWGVYLFNFEGRRAVRMACLAPFFLAMTVWPDYFAFVVMFGLAEAVSSPTHRRMGLAVLALGLVFFAWTLNPVPVPTTLQALPSLVPDPSALTRNFAANEFGTVINFGTLNVVPPQGYVSPATPSNPASLPRVGPLTIGAPEVGALASILHITFVPLVAFAPLLFLPLASRRWLPFFAPIGALLLLTNFWDYNGLAFFDGTHPAVYLPFLFLGALDVLSKHAALRFVLPIILVSLAASYLVLLLVPWGGTTPLSNLALWERAFAWVTGSA